MQYGFFDDAHREYVITTPRTPLPWINYLGNEAFFALCSNTAGGYCFYKDARLRRVTRYRYNNAPPLPRRGLCDHGQKPRRRLPRDPGAARKRRAGRGQRHSARPGGQHRDGRGRHGIMQITRSAEIRRCG